MKELHDLGSNYTWKTGDSIQYIERLIEQQKKINLEEDNNKKIWRDIFYYYKIHGRSDTIVKYYNISNIINLKYMFKKYFKDEFDDLTEKKEEQNNIDKLEIKRMKEEMISFGI